MHKTAIRTSLVAPRLHSLVDPGHACIILHLWDALSAMMPEERRLRAEFGLADATHVCIEVLTCLLSMRQRALLINATARGLSSHASRWLCLQA